MIDFDPRTEEPNYNDVSHSKTTGRDSSSDEQAIVNPPSNEVIPKKIKRRFSAKEKLRIITAADLCTQRGELGALLRKEGLYSSQIKTWKLGLEKSRISALTDKKRGRKPGSDNPFIGRFAESEKRNRILTKKLERAEEIIQFQKKFAELFGKIITLPEDIESM